MAKPALEFIGVRTGRLGQLKGKGVAHIVRPEWRNSAAWIADIRIVPAPNLFKNEIDGPQGESTIRSTSGHFRRTQKRAVVWLWTSRRRSVVRYSVNAWRASAERNTERSVSPLPLTRMMRARRIGKQRERAEDQNSGRCERLEPGVPHTDLQNSPR
jgi:hypothetical protein